MKLLFHRMMRAQSVTNIFIVNLALADILVMLFCAPPSIIWDVTNTWIFGSLMCKIVIYIQVRCN